MTTVDRIFQLMKEDGLTAKEFALKVGVSQGNITDWKTGRAKPSTEALLKISNAYNISVDYLLCKNNLKVQINEYEHFVVSNIISYIFTKYKNEIKKVNLSNVELNMLKECICNFVLNEDANVNDFQKISSDFNEPKKAQELYDFLVVEVLKIHSATFRYIPIEDNKNQTISNYYIYSRNFEELENKLNLEKQDLEFAKKIMDITNNKFIDGPIYEKNKTINKSQSKPNFYPVPVYGKISAGLPNWAEECLESYLPIDPNLMGIINPDECFFLRVDGESMNKVIRNGAYALIRKQDAVENGEICAVLVNGFEATLKKFSKQGDLVILEPMSDDSSFTTQVYNKETQIRIIGKYIGKFEMNK